MILLVNGEPPGVNVQNSVMKEATAKAQAPSFEDVTFYWKVQFRLVGCYRLGNHQP